MQQTIPANQPKPAREEMWLIIAAKSKTMRFFSVSCEFILFLGCLWLTMTTILPSASGWVNGSIDSFFLVAMGFAVDAAMPEAWLHVVDQWTDTPRKVMHLRWSISIAIAMSLLVVANVTYSKIAGTSGSQPTGGVEAFVNTLLISRILIGISYVAIRECQSFLNRKQAKQQPAQPALIDFQAMIDKAIESATSEQARVNQNILTALEEAKTTVAPIDFQAVANALVPQFQADFQAVTDCLKQDFQARFQAMDQAIFRQNITISEVQNQAKRLPEKAASTQATFRQKNQAENRPVSGKAKQSVQAEKNIIRLVPANASRDDLKAEAIRLHEVEGMSSYKIAETLGKSAKTVQSWLSSGKIQAESEEMEAIN